MADKARNLSQQKQMIREMIITKIEMPTRMQAKSNSGQCADQTATKKLSVTPMLFTNGFSSHTQSEQATLLHTAATSQRLLNTTDTIIPTLCQKPACTQRPNTFSTPPAKVAARMQALA
jgi:hexokinase